MFNKLSAKNAGSKGGKANTKVKGKAARANGRLGGRPPSKTLAERLLGRSIHPEQQKYIDVALSDMLSSERRQLEEYFQLDRGVLVEFFLLQSGKAMDSSIWRSRTRRVPKQVQYLIKKFRLAANHYLRDVPMPKPYTVEYEQLSLGEQQVWGRRHLESRIPCPPRKVRIDVRSLPEFRLIEFKHKRGVAWTVENLTEISDKWTRKRAEVAIKWLNATYPLDDLHKDAKRKAERPSPDSSEQPVFADVPSPTESPEFPWSEVFPERDDVSRAGDPEDRITPAVSLEFPFAEEYPEPSQYRDSDDEPDLYDLHEDPNLSSPDEPLEVAESGDSVEIPWSD